MSTSHTPIKIGISACLLGNPVRFNGGHKQSQLCSATLAQYFEFVPACPEVAIGLGTPRQPIRLVGDPANPQARGSVDANLEVTDALRSYGEQLASQLGLTGGADDQQQNEEEGRDEDRQQNSGVPEATSGGFRHAR